MPDLPTGTVTLLFTDIEGSTRLLHELGDEYAAVLAEHRRALRQAFAAHNGVEVDTQGDAFLYAFARASDALAAAEAGQRALEGGPVRVRMGLHTGEPSVTDEGYVGADVHLAARVMGAGHGGQVVVSEATAQFVESGLLRGLGAHRLKDIAERVQLFQLGEGRFSPLKTLSNSNLPLPQTPLLGRKKELADVLHLLRVERARLVTVTGPGGIGKTRFALEAAHELVEEFAHGVWLVDLSALRNPTLVVPTIASTLGAGGDLAEHVSDKRLLLALDNFEQVVEAATEVAELLRRCANVQLVVTSREPLQLGGERAYPLRPLPESPAVQLFRERADATDPSFDAPWETLAAIVDRLDRLPLAIELAAARAVALSADDLLARLDQRLPLLASRARDVPERQRTLHAAIEWSYELLTEDERALFARLAVFAGGWTLEAAERVAGADLDTLESLVEKSLASRAGERFGMLETIREYALERLDESADREAVPARHADFYAEVGMALGWRARDSDAEALAQLSAELDNLRTALAWSFANDELSTASRLISGAWWLWLTRGFAAEGDRATKALAGRLDANAPERALALALAGEFARFRGDVDRAVALKEEAIVLHERSPSARDLHAAAITDLAETLLARGDIGRAREVAERGLALRSEMGEATGVAHASRPLILIALAEGEYARARLLAERTADLWREEQSWSDLADTLVLVATARRELGDVTAAAQYVREALELAVRVGDLFVLAPALEEAAAVLVALGSEDAAARVFAAAKRERRRSGIATPNSELHDRLGTALGSRAADVPDEGPAAVVAFAASHLH